MIDRRSPRRKWINAFLCQTVGVYPYVAVEGTEPPVLHTREQHANSIHRLPRWSDYFGVFSIIPVTVQLNYFTNNVVIVIDEIAHLAFKVFAFFHTCVRGTLLQIKIRLIAGTVVLSNHREHTIWIDNDLPPLPVNGLPVRVPAPYNTIGSQQYFFVADYGDDAGRGYWSSQKQSQCYKNPRYMRQNDRFWNIWATKDVEVISEHDIDVSYDGKKWFHLFGDDPCAKHSEPFLNEIMRQCYPKRVSQ